MARKEEPINQAVKPKGKSVGQFVLVDGKKVPKADYDAQQKSKTQDGSK